MPRRKKDFGHVNLLKLIARLSPEKQNIIIRFLDENGINLLSETCYNVIFNDLNLTKRQKKKLKGKIKGKEKILKFIAKKLN